MFANKCVGCHSAKSEERGRKSFGRPRISRAGRFAKKAPNGLYILEVGLEVLAPSIDRIAEPSQYVIHTVHETASWHCG